MIELARRGRAAKAQSCCDNFSITAWRLASDKAIALIISKTARIDIHAEMIKACRAAQKFKKIRLALIIKTFNNSCAAIIFNRDKVIFCRLAYGCPLAFKCFYGCGDAAFTKIGAVTKLLSMGDGGESQTAYHCDDFPHELMFLHYGGVVEARDRRLDPSLKR